MTCDRCRIVAVEYPRDAWKYLLFNPACSYCNARHIQYHQRMQSGSKQWISEACKRILERAKEYGCDEKELRALAKKTEWAVEPQKGRR